jgi:hypothetical protein
MKLRSRRSAQNPADDLAALVACARFCMESETWPVFTAWVRAHPDFAGLCGEGEDEEDALWLRIEEGIFMLKTVHRLAPILLRALPRMDADAG